MKSVATLPAVLVEFDGARIGDVPARCLAAVRVRRRLSAPAQCELVFRGLEAPDTPRPGVSLRVAVAGQDTPLFVGDVTAVEHRFGADREHEVRVRGYDPLHRLRKTQRARSFVDVTVEDVARELASAFGATVEAATAGPLWPNLVQVRQTDLELLVTLAQRCGLFATFDDGTVRLLTLEGDGDEIELALGEELLEAQVELNGDTSCREATAAGWNPLSAEAFDGAATEPRSGRDVGAEIDADASGDVALYDEIAPDADHMTALAQAELDIRSSAEVTFWGVADGDANLSPGTRVRVRGLHDTLDGTYVLTEVTHRVDARHGYSTELSSAPPAQLERRSAAVTALGEVTDVDDPDGRGRVRVALLAHGEQETDWLGVVTAGAGAERGIVALPDVGDRVLVVFPHEELGAGLVLGGLYGSGGPADPGVADGATRRFSLRTSGGQQVTLDDEHDRLRIEDVTGSSLELSPELVKLHARRDLTIDASGHAVVVRAKTIDFVNAEQEA